MFDYYKNTNDAFSLFRQFFSHNESMSSTELAYNFNTLTQKHPSFYLYTLDNKNFLFLEDFYYSPNLLQFLSTKFDLNFLEGNKHQSPALFHLTKFLHNSQEQQRLKKYYETYSTGKTFSLEDAEKIQSLLVGRDNDIFLIIKSDTPAVIDFKLSFLQEHIKNFQSFSAFEQNLSYYKDEYRWGGKPNRHAISVITNRVANHVDSQYYCVKSHTIDWEKTISLIMNSTFRLDKYPEKEWRVPCDNSVDNSDSPTTSLLNLLIRLPCDETGVENKKILLSYLNERFESNDKKIDWCLPIDGKSLFYRIAANLLNPSNNVKMSEAWIGFMDELIYKEVIPQFSLTETFSTHHGTHSLYDMIEKHWIPNRERDMNKNEMALAYLKDFIIKGPILEEKNKIEDQVLTNPQKHKSNPKIKI